MRMTNRRVSGMCVTVSTRERKDWDMNCFDRVGQSEDIYFNENDIPTTLSDYLAIISLYVCVKDGMG